MVTSVSRLKPSAITRMTAWRHQGESGFSNGSVGMAGYSFMIAGLRAARRSPVMTNVIGAAPFMATGNPLGRRHPSALRAELPRDVWLRERAQRRELRLVKARGERRRDEVGRFLRLDDERHLDAREDSHGKPGSPHGVPEIGEDLAHLVRLGRRSALERAADRGTENADRGK